MFGKAQGQKEKPILAKPSQTLRGNAIFDRRNCETGNGELGTGNGEWELGTGNWERDPPMGPLGWKRERGESRLTRFARFTRLTR